MAVRSIVIHPDPRLRTVAAPVVEVNDEIRRLVDDMAETMYAAPGVGLAAPQIGVSKRVFVIDTAIKDDPANLLTFINPHIIDRRGEIIWEEGCLSFPDIHEEVQRAELVVARAFDRDGQPFEIEAEGLMAVALQHEYDHLDGVLFVDHLTYFKRRQIDRDMKKRALAQPSAG